MGRGLAKVPLWRGRARAIAVVQAWRSVAASARRAPNRVATAIRAWITCPVTQAASSLMSSGTTGTWRRVSRRVPPHHRVELEGGLRACSAGCRSVPARLGLAAGVSGRRRRGRGWRRGRTAFRRRRPRDACPSGAHGAVRASRSRRRVLRRHDPRRPRLAQLVSRAAAAGPSVGFRKSIRRHTRIGQRCGAGCGYSRRPAGVRGGRAIRPPRTHPSTLSARV